MFFADISHYQANVDLRLYDANPGHDRIVLKATEGTTNVDPRFGERWLIAGKLGLARIAYHFGRAVNNGGDEFDHLLRAVWAVGNLNLRDRLCLDIEDTATPQRAAAYVAEFTGRAAGRGFHTGLIYTGRWYANPHGITAAVVAPGWRQLWLSDYTNTADSLVRLPIGWTRAQLVARQYTDHAVVAGILGGCDYNQLIRDWITPTPHPTPDPLTERDMHPIMVYAQGKPMYLYWPATSKLVGIGDTVERDTLKKVHAEAGYPIEEMKLSVPELDQLIEFSRRVTA